MSLKHFPAPQNSFSPFFKGFACFYHKSTEIVASSEADSLDDKNL